MTDTPSKTETTLRRNDHGTDIREAYWPQTGMRSLSASFSDGTHRISLITHKDDDRRQTVLSAHRLIKIEISSDDSLALDIKVRSDDGTPMTINLFGVTLSDLLEAVAEAVASQTPITEDSHL